MVDAPDPALPTPSYEPLHRKNEHWGDPCDLIAMYEGPECIRIYATNANRINNRSGLKYDQTFLQMKEAETGIFAINETHADQMNTIKIIMC